MPAATIDAFTTVTAVIGHGAVRWCSGFNDDTFVYILFLCGATWSLCYYASVLHFFTCFYSTNNNNNLSAKQINHRPFVEQLEAKWNRKCSCFFLKTFKMHLMSWKRCTQNGQKCLKVWNFVQVNSCISESKREKRKKRLIGTKTKPEKNEIMHSDWLFIKLVNLRWGRYEWENQRLYKDNPLKSTRSPTYFCEKKLLYWSMLDVTDITVLCTALDL